MFQTVLQGGVCLREANLHDGLPVQIAIRVSDLSDKIPQPVILRSRRLKPDAVPLDKGTAVNRLRVDASQGFYAHHITNTSLMM
jgi:hypothetical protein